MSNRYTKEHYEDVAKVLHPYADASLKWGDGEYSTMDEVARDFADLFAADNPPSTRCWSCGDSKEVKSICTRPNEGHSYGGFDRKQFLAACGLESS